MFSAIDQTGSATGTVGAIYQFGGTYGGATGQQQDDANAYAHAIGNVSG